MDRRAAAAFVIASRDASKARAPALIEVVADRPTPTALMPKTAVRRAFRSAARFVEGPRAATQAATAAASVSLLDREASEVAPGLAQLARECCGHQSKEEASHGELARAGRLGDGGERGLAAAPPDSLGDDQCFREQEQPRRGKRHDGRHEARRLDDRGQTEEAAADGGAGDQGGGARRAREVWFTTVFTAAAHGSQASRISAAARGCPRTAAACPAPRDECERLQGTGSRQV